MSYFPAPTPAGSAAVNTWQQALQRRRSISNTVAFTGDCPTMRISVFGSFCRYTFPSRHSGQGSPGLSCACGTQTFSAPVKALAALRPWPSGADASGSGDSTAAEDEFFGSSTELVF